MESSSQQQTALLGTLLVFSLAFSYKKLIDVTVRMPLDLQKN
jgi:hypothetical protein